MARSVLRAFALIVLALAFSGGRAAAQSGRYHAVVDAAHRGTEGGRTGGVPTWRTIGAALAAAPAGDAPYRVLVRNGRYHEKLSVTRPNVHLTGESRDGAVLTYDAAAGHAAPGGGTWGTRGSFTLRVAAPGFRLQRMTVENAFDYMANRRKAADDPTRLEGSQGVAVLTDSASDRSFFGDCVLRGHQDTLFTDGDRAYFTGCTILGSVDFIFGGGRTVFEDCDIISLDRGSRTNNGYITAPSTPLSQPFGLVFIRGRLRKESPSMAANSVVLGRPWHPGADPTLVGSAVFIDTWMDDHVSAAGWTRMSMMNAAGERTWYEPEMSRFFEYGSTGPGAAPSPSRRVLTEQAAAYFTVAQVLRGWSPRAE